MWRAQFGSVSGTVRKVLGGAPVAAPGMVVYVRGIGARTTTAADGTFTLSGGPK